MNPFGLDATGLMIWGLVAHLIADWPLQNDWMANNKARRWPVPTDDAVWFMRHPAAYVHAGIHGALLALVFGWVAAPLALAHLVIDTRAPVVWWSRLMRQTQPALRTGFAKPTSRYSSAAAEEVVLYDVGLEVRFWTDQVFHIACIALAALVVA